MFISRLYDYKYFFLTIEEFVICPTWITFKPMASIVHTVEVGLIYVYSFLFNRFYVLGRSFDLYNTHMMYFYQIYVFLIRSRIFTIAD